MKYLTIFLFAISLQAATYYVSSVGSDSNNGSQGAPWLTISHAVSSLHCGDTLNVVANGSYVTDGGQAANLPAFGNCVSITTVQSSALAQFAPVGWRTNPANDSANYGKLQFTFQGFGATPGVYTFNAYYSTATVSFNTGTNVITIAGGNGLNAANIANGSQIEFEFRSNGSSHGTQIFPVILPPSGISFFTHYYVISCSGCGAQNTTFQIAAAPGSSTPVAFGTCGDYCANTVSVDPSGVCTTGQIQYNPSNSAISDCRNVTSHGTGTWQTSGTIYISGGVTTGADTVANTITIPSNFGSSSLANNMPVSFSAAGFQSYGTLPEPLQLDQIYYIVNLNGLKFQVALIPGGLPIRLITVGTGMISTASTAIPSLWAFRGLELMPLGAHYPVYLFAFGFGRETSLAGMSRNMEVDRCYLHDNPPSQGLTHTIIDNGRFIYIHDSWIIGANAGEAQALFGAASPGPTVVTNNFIEAAAEIVVYGGDWSPYSAPNAYKIFSGNYFYKPPAWWQLSGSGAASGPCLYDATTDPTHAGGQWYQDTMAGQNYQCSPGGTWATTASALPPNMTIKNMTEFKNGSWFSYIGNLYNGSFAQAQSGEVFNHSMEFDSGPGAANDHITIMNNAMFNSLQFMTRTSQCFPAVSVCPVFPGTHATVNNLMVVNPLACGTSFNSGLCGYRGNQSFPGGTKFDQDWWNKNTIWIPDTFPFGGISPMVTDTPTGLCPPFTPVPNNHVIYQNSVVAGDFLAACDSPASGTIIPDYFRNSTFTRNVFKGATGNYSNVGAGNTWTLNPLPIDNSAIHFVNDTGTMAGDYHLHATSPYSAASGSPTQLSSDGTDLGADVDLINMATSGAAAGTPPWDQQAGLRVNPGSTQVVFRYTSPTADPCTATIYGAPARIPGNQVASAADSSANSISDALTRELYISGLQPSTQYWYKLACGGGVLMVGNLLTLAPGLAPVQFGFDWNSPTPMQYSSSPSMSNPVSLTAATRQFVPVAANSVVYVQAGVAGPITMLIAP